MNVLCSIYCLLHIFAGRGKYVGTSCTAIGETAVMPLGPGHAQNRKGGKPSISYQLIACPADPGQKGSVKGSDKAPSQSRPATASP